MSCIFSTGPKALSTNPALVAAANSLTSSHSAAIRAQFVEKLEPSPNAMKHGLFALGKRVKMCPKMQAYVQEHVRFPVANSVGDQA